MLWHQQGKAMHWIALSTPEVTTTAEATEADTVLADPYAALAWWMLQFTPMVARVEDALVLEVSGSERLFGGRSALLAQIFASNRPVASVRYAQGATSLVALGRLWHGCEIPANGLPVHTLAAARPHLPTLSRLGVATWGQLRALPRGGLVRRFGAELVDALDRAYGLRPELYPWLTVPDVFDAPLELAASVETAPALLFGARRLLAQLLAWLRARQRGVLALELLWELDARRSNTLHVDAHHHGGQQGRLELRTAQATQDMQHLQRLLGEQLVRVHLPAPVLYLRLRTLQTQTLGGESHSLLMEDQRNGDSLHQTLERLGARLGPEQVRCVHTQADHSPERMQCWQPWVPLPGPSVAIKKVASWAMPGRADAQYPSWILPAPLRLAVHPNGPHYQGVLTLLAGPQRLEAGWLEGSTALRDYYIARSATAGLVWIYRERLQHQNEADGPCWYLHGLFA
jgi:protein ImuB